MVRRRKEEGFADRNDIMEEPKSRSRKKRESTALQKQGQYLAGLSSAVQRTLPLSPELLEALEEWRGLKTHEAKRRHMQYIGRLMRELDDQDALLEALEDLDNNRRRDTREFRHLEELRDRLLQPGPDGRETALEECLVQYPSLERGRLLHVVEAALAEREKKRPPRQGRELFRPLRDAAEASED